jgi:hypothetical protein
MVAVTVGLLVGGALLGGLAALAALVLGGLLSGMTGFLRTDVLLVAGGAGAFIGGVLLPLTSWALLRRVPLGRTLAGTVMGTVGGALLGWAIVPLGANLLAPVGGAIAGFFAAAFVMRARSGRSVPGGRIAAASPEGADGLRSTPTPAEINPSPRGSHA